VRGLVYRTSCPTCSSVSCWADLICSACAGIAAWSFEIPTPSSTASTCHISSPWVRLKLEGSAHSSFACSSLARSVAICYCGCCWGGEEAGEEAGGFLTTCSDPKNYLSALRTHTLMQVLIIIHALRTHTLTQVLIMNDKDGALVTAVVPEDEEVERWVHCV